MNREVTKEILKQLPAVITALLTGIALLISQLKSGEKTAEIDEQKETIYMLVDQVKSITELIDDQSDDQP
jgi:hypothetical protein